MWNRLRKMFSGHDAPATVRLQGDGSYGLQVVGDSKYQEALNAACGHATPDAMGFVCQAQLVTDDWHPYDRTAVKVLIDGRRIGYLQQPDAIAYRWHLRQAGKPDAVGTCAACIMLDSDRGHDDGAKHLVARLDLRLAEKELPQRAAAATLKARSGHQLAKHRR